MNFETIKIVFLGSSTFAVPSLQGLIELGIKPLVVTKPDRPAGRGKKLQFTPIKEEALRHPLQIMQPNTLRDASIIEQIAELHPDLLISIAYGGYIPKEVLDIPKYRCINLHPSLLPKYRGAAPVQRAIMQGETETGLTISYVSAEWDAGDILVQTQHPIAEDDTAGSLLDKLGTIGKDLICDLLPNLFEGNVKATPQDASKATFAPLLNEKDTWIDWEKSGKQIVNQVRGLSPEPTARSLYEHGLIKIYKAQYVSIQGTPGIILEVRKKGPVVGAGEGGVLLLEVQPENRKILSGKDFVNGYHPKIGQAFQAQCSGSSA